jgi:AcrR family transcriptional regulator
MSSGKTPRGNHGGTVDARPALVGRRGRRPGGRSARVRSAVLQSAFAVLTEKGIDAFTVAEVASRAGVHETSIYRRWGTLTALALEACLHFADTALAIPDTGSLRSDLVALMARLTALLSSPQGQAFHALSGSRHPDAVAARRSYFRQRFDLARVIFDRAVSRGEFPRHADPMVFLETLIAPLYLRLRVTGEPLEDWPTNEMIDRLLAAYAVQRK